MSEETILDKVAASHKYEDKWMPVNSLEVDRRVQRTTRKPSRVEYLIKHWRDDAAGLAHVSHRSDGSNVILDGDHRNEAQRQRTDNQGQLFCRVFEGLTLEEEGEIFLFLNPGNEPTVVEKYKVGVNTNEPQAVRIDALCHAFGYTVDGVAANGHINAISVLRRIDDDSFRVEAEPHLLHATLLVISRAWGNNRYGTQAAILNGIARLISEHGSRLDLDLLIDKLKNYKGGPQGLLAETKLLSNIRNMQHAMAVADQITNEYNKGKTRNALPAWRHRR